MCAPGGVRMKTHRQRPPDEHLEPGARGNYSCGHATGIRKNGTSGAPADSCANVPERASESCARATFVGGQRCRGGKISSPEGCATFNSETVLERCAPGERSVSERA